ncbi:flagellin [Candidatus Halocynthiibacter alkanivorans]|uniref:flagellin N-terminal helical domain-containing protein n=1 Tax=Candidatus Halocynthiibacter alkanivorans TaxID=2267619 RepID=UPI000DF250D9|nr:flagellin [Candidatus Halocynthiibacter alkanivorans]
MSSILTNSSAMVALQTLKSVNKNLEETQGMISTGKSVATAKDNSSVWAISKVMESDVKGFEGISDSLALGESSVAVAANASETITDLLTDIKGKIVAAQEENVDRDKIQTDINKLTDQIGSIVGAAQFNGMNLLKGTDDINILSSLDRSSDGTVTASSITVSRQDMSTSAGTYGTGTSLAPNATASAAAVANTGNSVTVALPTTDADMSDNANMSITVAGAQLTFATGDFATSDDQDAAAIIIKDAINALGLDGITATINGTNAYEIDITSTRAFEDVTIAGTGDITAATTTIGERAETVAFSNTASVNDGDGYKVTIGSDSYEYVAGKGETMEDVAKGLKTAIDSAGLTDISTQVSKNSTSGEWELKVDNAGSSVGFSATGNAGGEASGGMFGLDNIDVTTDGGASAALSNIETMINGSIDAAAEFGSARSQIETQTEFVSQLTDSLKQGIGGMVDADMEETSARLQALQVQQQLATQSLTIANQAPQSILSLFG